MLRRIFARYLALFIPSCLLGVGLTKLVCEQPQPTTEPQPVVPKSSTGWETPKPTKPIANVSSGNICFNMRQDIQKYYDPGNIGNLFYHHGIVTVTIGYDLANADGDVCGGKSEFVLKTRADCKLALDHVDYLATNYKLSAIDQRTLELARSVLSESELHFEETGHWAFESETGKARDIRELTWVDPQQTRIDGFVTWMAAAPAEDVANLPDRFEIIDGKGGYMVLSPGSAAMPIPGEVVGTRVKV